MRWLLGAVALAAALWSGLWFVAARIADLTLRDWIAAQGGEVAADVSVAGFPNRVDVTASNLSAGDVRHGPGWQAPFVQVFAMMWKPWHLIAALPHEQTITLPGGLTVAVGSDRLQASLVLVPDDTLALDRLNVAGEGLRIMPTGMGGPLRLGTLRLAAHRDPETPEILHLGVEALEVLPPPALRAAFPADRPAPDGALHLRLDARVELSAPLDRNLAAPPVPLAVEVADFTLDWGPMDLAAKGVLAVDPQGYLEGELKLDLTGWRAALDLAVAAGALQPGVADTWAAFGAQLQDPATGRIALPLTYRGGSAHFGPLPIGIAPRVWR